MVTTVKNAIISCATATISEKEQVTVSIPPETTAALPYSL
jgi:hypothetical protein